MYILINLLLQLRDCSLDLLIFLLHHFTSTILFYIEGHLIISIQVHGICSCVGALCLTGPLLVVKLMFKHLKYNGVICMLLMTCINSP